MHLVLGAEGLHQVPSPAQAVAGQARPQVVLHLKLQTTVEPVHVLRAVDVQSGGDLIDVEAIQDRNGKIK